jgi:hypothetical protein
MGRSQRLGWVEVEAEVNCGLCVAITLAQQIGCSFPVLKMRRQAHREEELSQGPV